MPAFNPPQYYRSPDEQHAVVLTGYGEEGPAGQLVASGYLIITGSNYPLPRPLAHPPVWSADSLYCLLFVSNGYGGTEFLLLDTSGLIYSRMEKVFFLPRIDDFKGGWITGLENPDHDPHPIKLNVSEFSDPQPIQSIRS